MMVDKSSVKLIARYSIYGLWAITGWQLYIWFLGIGLAAMIVLTNRFDLVTSDMEMIGMVTGTITLFLPMLIGTCVLLEYWFENISERSRPKRHFVSSEVINFNQDMEDLHKRYAKFFKRNDKLIAKELKRRRLK